MEHRNYIKSFLSAVNKIHIQIANFVRKPPPLPEYPRWLRRMIQIILPGWNFVKDGVFWSRSQLSPQITRVVVLTRYICFPSPCIRECHQANVFDILGRQYRDTHKRFPPNFPVIGMGEDLAAIPRRRGGNLIFRKEPTRRWLFIFYETCQSCHLVTEKNEKKGSVLFCYFK